MKLNIRSLNDTDWDVLQEWWKQWPEWVAPARDFLPNNGKCGFMVEKNDKPIIAGFVYLTNSKTALLEWIISDPEYRESDRKDALEMLINTSEGYCKELGYKYMFSVCRSKKLIETHRKLNWAVDDDPAYELVKVIN
tara:strand:+ start:317 stop:727 length:411 start_codon:yes stop_codon:yes gene_type:complete